MRGIKVLLFSCHTSINQWKFDEGETNEGKIDKKR